MNKNIFVKGFAGLIIAGASFTGAGAAMAAPSPFEGNENCSQVVLPNGNSAYECASSHYTNNSNGWASSHYVKRSDFFSDVYSTDIFFNEINWLYENGISTGWSDGTYRQNETVKRDVMITFLYRMAGSPAYTAPKVSPFKDVSTKHVFYKEIAWAYENGITEGWKMKDGSREFRPSEDVKRDAVAAFMYRYHGANDTSTKTNFKDVSSNTIFAKEIAWMEKSGLANGWGTGEDKVYKPSSLTKRDAMAAFIYRYMVEMPKNG